MASEIRYSFALNIAKGSYIRQFDRNRESDLLAVAPGVAGPQRIGTIAEPVIMGDVVDAGIAWFQNVGETEIQVGPNTSPFVPFLRIPAGQTCGPLWLGSDDPLAVSIGGNGLLDYFIQDRGETT